MSRRLVILIFSATLLVNFAYGAKSRGQVCLGSTGITQNHNEVDCDNSLTNLICYEGRCACPEALTMSSANLPSNLNTWWHRDLKKCVGIRGSRCGNLGGRAKKISCLPGATCVLDKSNKALGICSS